MCVHVCFVYLCYVCDFLCVFALCVRVVLVWLLLCLCCFCVVVVRVGCVLAARWLRFLRVGYVLVVCSQLTGKQDCCASPLH